MTIEGPGATNLTINANYQSRIFDINDGSDATDIDVEIDGLTVTAGNGLFGGPFFHRKSAAELRKRYASNASYYGGGIYVATSAEAVIENCMILGNTAYMIGGGIYAGASHGGTTTIQASTISGNKAGSGGGIFADTSYGGTTTIADDEISGNTSYGGGGGICRVERATQHDDDPEHHHFRELRLRGRRRIWANISYDGPTTIQNSTITGNTADSDSNGSGKGGGNLLAAGTVSVASTIIAGNGDHSHAAPDVSGSLILSHSLIGDNTGSALTEAPVGSPDAGGNLIGGPIHGVINPKLGPLAQNGGPTQTCALFAGSPAIDMGSNPASLSYDQRRLGLSALVGLPGRHGGLRGNALIGLPTVAAISPATGTSLGGTTVLITGTGFADATAVYFGSGEARAFAIVSDTQIEATSPAGAGHGGRDRDHGRRRFRHLLGRSVHLRSHPRNVPTVGLYDPSSSMFLLRYTNDSGFADEVCPYGVAEAGMLPIVGDWNGDGIQSIGLYDPVTSTFYLRNTNCLQGPDDPGYADCVFVYGPANAGYEPVVGDWNGDGTDTVGLYDPLTSTFYLRNSNSLQGPNDHGYADIVFNYGPANSGMLPVAGDWDGSGKDGIGLYSQATSTFYLREATQLQGPNDHAYADAILNYGVGQRGLLPIAGDWNGDGKDGIGLYDQASSIFFLRNTIQLQGPTDQGFADLTFMYGRANGLELPVAGDWTGPANTPFSSGSFTSSSTSTRLTASAAQLQTLVAAADSAAVTDSTTSILTMAQLQPIVSAAIDRWASAGLDAATVAKLRQVQFTIGDLPGATLGEEQANLIRLDGDAAGYGWFVDSTPASDEEFALSAGSHQLQAVDPRAVDHIDLLTVVEHELGHAAGLGDLDALAGDVMSGMLGVGIRRDVSHADAVLAS